MPKNRKAFYDILIFSNFWQGATFSSFEHFWSCVWDNRTVLMSYMGGTYETVEENKKKLKLHAKLVNVHMYFLIIALNWYIVHRCRFALHITLAVDEFYNRSLRRWKHTKEKQCAIFPCGTFMIEKGFYIIFTLLSPV